ncbi:hypothetical protein [Klebsiella quasipneumoniae]|uniref:hypothetical protein n=1 Tax=Klebsiella quasipneumoniae TaxID=1463165 RepID=UPI00388CF912
MPAIAGWAKRIGFNALANPREETNFDGLQVMSSDIVGFILGKELVSGSCSKQGRQDNWPLPGNTRSSPACPRATTVSPQTPFDDIPVIDALTTKRHCLARKSTAAISIMSKLGSVDAHD